MSATALRVAAFTSALLASAGAVAYLGSDDPPLQMAEVMLLLDTSISVNEDICSEAEAVARALVRASSGQLVIHPYGLSGRSRDGQPTRLGGDITLAAAGSPLHGADERAADQQRTFEAVGKACRASPRTKESPIFAAVTALFAQINGLGVRPGTARAVIIVSDGVEEGDPELTRALKGGRPPREARIDNAGVITILCGTAARAPHRGRLASPQTVAEAWRAQFKAPATILPSCQGLESVLSPVSNQGA